jgi:hypothetical protein
MKRVCLTVLLSTVFVASAFVADTWADEFPARKPGEWDITIMRGDKAAGTIKMCVDKETDQLLYKIGGGLSHQFCQHSDVKVTGNVVTSQSECTIHGSTVTALSITTFDGDTAFHLETKSHFDPAFLGKTDVVTKQEGKWVGDCPADMKPGDFVMGHGIKVNIKMLDALQKHLPH